MSFDLSRVPHMEVRKAVQAYKADIDKVEEEEAAAIKEICNEIDAADALVDEKIQALEAEHVTPLKDKREGIRAPFYERREKVGAVLQETLTKAGLEWDDVRFDERCAATGLPLLMSDEVLSNDDYEEFLASALLPPAPLAEAAE